LINPQTGETVRSYMERSYGEDHVLDALDVIAADVRRDLGESLYQIHRSDRPLPQVTTSSLTALKQYADGSTLWRQGKYKEATTLFRAAVQSDPDFAMAHAALGSNYFSYIANAPIQGKEEYEKALALSSRTTDRERLIIQTSYAADLEHIVDADVLYRAYLRQYPDDWPMLSDYALLLRRHGRPGGHRAVQGNSPGGSRRRQDLYRDGNGLPDHESIRGSAQRLRRRISAGS
jgi:tetratricopeptide (TPR) repeat protein